MTSSLANECHSGEGELLTSNDLASPAFGFCAESYPRTTFQPQPLQLEMRALHIYSLLAAIPVIACTNNDRYQQQPLINTQCDRPNVVFILTDDQDTHLNSLDYMPHVKRHLLDKGTYFTKHYCTTAVCCPSRATLWTGKQSHNTNITDVSPPYGMDNPYILYRELLTDKSIQEVTPSSLKMASTTNTCPSGCNRPAITHTTQASC